MKIYTIESLSDSYETTFYGEFLTLNEAEQALKTAIEYLNSIDTSNDNRGLVSQQLNIGIEEREVGKLILPTWIPNAILGIYD